MKNLGNIAGIVKGYDPPLESDGVTEKRYVIWAKTLNTTPVSYKLMYYDVFKSGWFPIVGVPESDFNLINHYVFNTLNLSEIPSILDERSVTNLIELFDNKADINHTHPDLEDYINDLQSGLDNQVVINENQDERLENLEGINYTWSPTNRTLTLYDNNGNQLSQVSLVSLDNEGTDIRYNASTLSLELYNADNELLDSIPVSSFIGSVGTQLQLNSNQLQLKDGQGNVLSTVSFAVSNIQELQTALDGKLDKGSYIGTAQDLYTHIEGKIEAGYNCIPKVGNGASGKVLESSVIGEINGKIGIGIAGEPSEQLEVGGNVKAKSNKFTLQSSITPQPNMLIAKTDGSGLIWYNNSSIGSALLFLPSEWIFGLGSGLISTNTAIGKDSLKSNSTGADNTSIGWNALINNTTGNYNTAIGRSALSGNTGGYSNTAIGYLALAGNINGIRNIAVGSGSQRFSTGNDNCSFGESSLVNSGGAVSNSVFGSGSGYSCSGNSNSAFGHKTLYSCSGANNVAIGAGNAYSIGSGNKCVFVGAVDFGFSSTANATNMIAIGFNVAGKGSNTVELGNDSIINTYLKGKVNLNNRLKLASYTKTQRDALTNKEVGDMIWQTDSGNSGIRVYDGTNWLALQTTID